MSFLVFEEVGSGPLTPRLCHFARIREGEKRIYVYFLFCNVDEISLLCSFYETVSIEILWSAHNYARSKGDRRLTCTFVAEEYRMLSYRSILRKIGNHYAVFFVPWSLIVEAVSKIK